MYGRIRMSRRAMGMAAGCVVGAMLTSTAWAAEDAKALYEKSCVSCHGPAGKGDGPAGKRLKEPPADFSIALKGASDEDIAKAIKLGGKGIGKAPTMPAYGSKLSDEQIASLAAYVKALK